MLEMISTALLLLQLALHYNVEGKHFLVKTKDKTTQGKTKAETTQDQTKAETKQDQRKDKASLEEHSPTGQVSDFTRMSYQIYKSINIYECHTRSIIKSINIQRKNAFSIIYF